ncbi:YggT family protein [Arsenophonus symbiont of Ornithomya chloropus]|uniref:YggT family protein n=1 Tax=Arsenophonus symbiont of Ornithomya chloropus TaxID=634121 RepID=UPI0032B20A3B
MQFLSFIIPTIIQLYIIILILRIWMQWVKSDFYNPFVQFVIKSTQPIIGRVNHFIPSIRSIDTASLLVAYIITLSNILFIMWATNSLSLISITLLPISIIQLFNYIGKLIFWLILIRSLLTWINQGNHPIDYMLIELTEPLIIPIRRMIPPFFGLDFSSMIIILILIALNYLRLDILLFLDEKLTNTLYSMGYLM